MYVREVKAKKFYLRQFNRLRPGVLALGAAFLLAACGTAPVTVVTDTGAKIPPDATAPVADPEHPGVAALPPGAVVPSAGQRPPPAPVARPANKPALQASKNFVRTAWAQVPGWQADDIETVWNTFQDN
jgi:membrane-bound lytic murein transglycosylase A